MPPHVQASKFDSTHPHTNKKRPGNAGPFSLLQTDEAYRFASVVWITNFLRIASM